MINRSSGLDTLTCDALNCRNQVSVTSATNPRVHVLVNHAANNGWCVFVGDGVRHLCPTCALNVPDAVSMKTNFSNSDGRMKKPLPRFGPTGSVDPSGVLSGLVTNGKKMHEVRETTRANERAMVVENPQEFGEKLERARRALRFSIDLREDDDGGTHV